MGAGGTRGLQTDMWVLDGLVGAPEQKTGEGP